jgi:glutamate synthase domain-containing protein 2/glutamate synthase domain-containing protein 1/glutamate synthase domain-containing protein 3
MLAAMEPKLEHASCGVGFVAALDGQRSHAIVRSTLHALRNVEHRGAVGPDGLSSDGAGIMTEIPFALLGHEPGTIALATLFVDRDVVKRDRALTMFEETFAFLGMNVLAYRDVPHNLDVLGERARATCPGIVQATLRRPEQARTDAAFNSRLYRAQQITRTKLKAAGAWMDLFFVSLSTSTVVYKALCPGRDLDQFYPDLATPRFVSRFGLLHRRFSTNTRSTWDKAQPFRLVAHNGEINTIAGNRSWAFSRERARGLGRDELLTREGISDSGSLNEMVEALKYRSSMPHLDDILAIMVPAADAHSDFYEFWGRAMEPWDGPALLAYCDGETVGARLDRNGFRPARWCMTKQAFYLASEAGAFSLPSNEVVAKGTLNAGSGVTVLLPSGKVHFRDPSESRQNAGATFDARLVDLADVPARMHPDAYAAIEAPVAPQLLGRQALFGVTEEEIDRVLRPMIADAKEPIGSMGHTGRPAIFSDQPHALYDFFYQDFAQVTNPPLDYLREAMVTDLTTQVGQRPNIFAPTDLIPLTPALRLSDPVVRLGQMAVLRALTVRRPSSLRTLAFELSAVYERARGSAGLDQALSRVGAEALAAVRDGCTILIITDRHADFEQAPVPSLLALRSVVTTLNRHGHRLDASLVVEAGDIRSTHALACAIGFGATAVCPRLALELARFGEHAKLPPGPGAEREERLCRAFAGGLLKVMAKMGISVVRSYQSSKLFTPLGLGPRLVAQYFGTVPSALGGLELPQLAEWLEYGLAWAEGSAPGEPLASTYQHKEKKRGWDTQGPEGGERHSMTAERSKLIHDLVRERFQGRDPDAIWTEYLAQGEAVTPVSPRHLLDLRIAPTPVPESEIEDDAAILSRFGSGAMSFGAINAESQRDIFVAMRSVGARCNSGEGGENPYYFVDGTTAVTKQIASGRFGVTAEYLVTGEEIEIKIAQGAKPGEGGQLMGVKVDADIARARFARPGVDLISPPPMHDIYSIEDLAQLIYELKQLSPGTPVCVKLVAGANVGTVAAGVVKAGADVVQISGGDGGTGAASISSMQHAGLPWELGLVDAHRQLVEHGLRDQVRLRVDGGLSSPRDVVIAALLGAEEYGFGKLLLIAEGCIMARICEKNRCPTGIATHDPKFKAKYKGSPEHVVALLRRMAAGIRTELSRLGARSLGEIIGQRRWLEAARRHEHLAVTRGVDIGPMLAPIAWSRAESAAPPTSNAQGWSALERGLVAEVLAQLDAGGRARVSRSVRNTDRAIATGLSGELARRAAALRRAALSGGGETPPLFPAEGAIKLELEGSAGQGLAAFAVPGLDLSLRGEANDGVAKSMSGGRIVIRPPADAPFIAEDNVILGNGALYGATGGTLYVHGRAGDRFAVRNSGATAVAEGAGLHACEYMTSGTVVILGAVSANAGAGMTGGRLYLPTEQRELLNLDYVAAQPLDDTDLDDVTAILRDYIEATGSRTAAALCAERAVLRRRLIRAWPRRDLAARGASPALRAVAGT